MNESDPLERLVHINPDPIAALRLLGLSTLTHFFHQSFVADLVDLWRGGAR